MKTIMEMCKSFLAERREMVRRGDPDALAPRTVRDPETHRNEGTMRRVYDRRRTINVKPIA